jgi:hypothetical protein
MSIYAKPISISTVSAPKIKSKSEAKKVLRTISAPNLSPTRALLIPKEKRKIDKSLTWMKNHLEDLKSYLTEYTNPQASTERKKYLNQKSYENIDSMTKVLDWYKQDNKLMLLFKNDTLLNDGSYDYLSNVLYKYQSSTSTGIKNHQLLDELDINKINAAILNISAISSLYKENFSNQIEKTKYANSRASIHNISQINQLKQKIDSLTIKDKLKLYELQVKWSQEKLNSGYALLLDKPE